VTEDQQAALEKPAVRVVYFVEFQFASGTQRVCTFNMSYDWNGHTWLGLGMIGDISPIEQGGGAAPKALKFVLSAADPALIALAAGPADEYRRRKVKMWFCPLDENYRMIGEPELCWSGTMSTMAIEVPAAKPGETANSTIGLQCETAANGLRRPANFRLNPAQHKQRYPGDLGCDYLPDLIARPALWLSKKFQRI